LCLELPQTQIGSVLRLLFQSHAYYIDRPSRKAVRTCFQSLYENPEYSRSFIERIIPAIKSESQKPGIAASNAFVLLEWTAELFPRVTTSSDTLSTEFNDLLVATVSLLDICLGLPHAKPSLKLQALKITRRGLRATYKGGDHAKIIPAMVGSLTSKGSLSTQKNALLLGIVCGVCARQPKPREVLEGSKKDIYTFYTREILGSRTLVSNHIAGALSDFFSNFTTAEDFGNEVLPSLEKGLLRSPEILLNDLVTPLFRSLPSDIDLSNPLFHKLLRQFLSCLKSINPVIRNGAVSAFKLAISRSHDEATIEKIVNEILNPLKSGKIPSADQRILYALMLDSVPSSKALAKLVPLGLSALVAREPNEGALIAIASASSKHLATGLRSDISVEKPVIDAINKGLADKRPAVRRTWFVKVGELIWDFPGEPTPVLRELCRGVTEKLLDVFDEVMTNPLPAAQNGLIVAAYITVAVALDRLILWDDAEISPLLERANIARHCLNVSAAKVPFMLNVKAYSKLSSDDDHRWAIRSLSATANRVMYENKHSDLWALAFLYLICAASVSPQCRKEACAALSAVYLKHPESVGKIILSGIWFWLKSTELDVKDSSAYAAKTGASNIKHVIYALALPVNAGSSGLETSTLLSNEIVKNLLVNLIALSHHELVQGVDWISLCQKSGVDPGQLATEKSGRLINEIKLYTGLSGKSPTIRNAALKSAATLAFVSPATITPLIVKLLQDDLDPIFLNGIGPTEVSIWRTPPGITFVDVLSNSGSKVQEKSKDAADLKWEAEVRAELAKKKGTERKLTADEKAKIAEQLAKEAVIRNKVDEVELRLSRGVGIILSLAEGAPTAVEMWLHQAVKALQKSLEAGAGMIVQDKGINAFLVRASPPVLHQLSLIYTCRLVQGTHPRDWASLGPSLELLRCAP
jgi:hypothetical protein